jgi:hypothetical protein
MRESIYTSPRLPSGGGVASTARQRRNVRMHGRSLIAAPLLVEEAFTDQLESILLLEGSSQTPQRSAGVNLRSSVTARIRRSTSLTPPPCQPCIMVGRQLANRHRRQLDPPQRLKTNRRCVCWAGYECQASMKSPGCASGRRLAVPPTLRATGDLPLHQQDQDPLALYGAKESATNWYSRTRQVGAVVAVDPPHEFQKPIYWHQPHLYPVKPVLLSRPLACKGRHDCDPCDLRARRQRNNESSCRPFGCGLRLRRH